MVRTPHRGRTAVAAALLPAVLGATGCVAPRAGVVPLAAIEPPAHAARRAPQESADGAGRAPLVVDVDADDWLQTTSGEWLNGELIVLEDDEVTFDSEELDEVQVDWEDVRSLITTRRLTVVTNELVTYVGVVSVQGDEVRLTGGDAPVVIPRADVFRILREQASWRDYWRGTVSLGLTVREGNSDQFDYTGQIRLTRRTPRTRLELYTRTEYSEVTNVAVTDNHRFNADYDYFFSRRRFWKIVGSEVYRDRFQNIRVRSTSYTAYGYSLVDDDDTQWEVDAGPGYRYLELYSVPAGDDATDQDAIFVVDTFLDHELTQRVDLILEYRVDVGLEDLKDTNQTLHLGISVDLLRDLDLDVDLYWDRTGLPVPDVNGDVPEEDDFRLVVGVEFEF